MCDRTDSSTSNGEWERVNDNDMLEIREKKINELSEKIRKMEEEMKEKDEETTRQILAKDEENQRIMKENALLRSRIEQNEGTFTLDKWMKQEIEEIKLSIGKLSEKTMEVYKTIWQKGVSKQQTTTSSERRKLTEEIQKLEDLCEKIAKDVKKVNEESIHELTKHLQIDIGEKSEDKKQTKGKVIPIDRFLGKFSPAKRTHYSQLEIVQVDNTRYYEAVFTYKNGKTDRGEKWIPDDEQRGNMRAWIDGSSLYMNDCGIISQYELCEQGLKCFGLLYVRI